MNRNKEAIWLVSLKFIEVNGCFWLRKNSMHTGGRSLSYVPGPSRLLPPSVGQVLVFRFEDR